MIPYDNKQSYIDLSNKFIEIYDQGNIGSCVVNAFAAVLNYYTKEKIIIKNNIITDNNNKIKYKHIPELRPSRYYLYYYSSSYRKSIELEDKIRYYEKGGGTSLAYLIKNINAYGILEELEYENETNWLKNKLYDNPITNNENEIISKKIKELKNRLISNNDPNKKNQIIQMIKNYEDCEKKISENNIAFDINSTKIKEAYKWRNMTKVISIYKNMINSKDPNIFIRRYLQNGIPILLLIKFKYIRYYKLNINNKILSDVEQTTDNNITSDNINHMMVIVGYDDKKSLYKIRNSWGSKWSDNGYGYLPYEIFSREDINDKHINNIYIIEVNFDRYFTIRQR